MDDRIQLIFGEEISGLADHIFAVTLFSVITKVDVTQSSAINAFLLEYGEF